MTVRVTATRTLAAATLYRKLATAHPHAMSRSANTATKTLTGIQRPTITWWVTLKSTDGATFTSATKTQNHPCYANPP
jgi:hypothetical protein